MSERIPLPADFKSIEWRTNPLSPNASNPPSAGKRADGWPFKAPYPHDEGNYIFNLIGRLFEWAGSSVVRVFDDIFDALEDPTAPLATDQQFSVRNYNPFSLPAGGGWNYGAPIYGLTPPGFSDIQAAACDGGRDFWVDVDGGTVNVYACKPIDGAQVWAISPGDVSDNAIAASGDSVFMVGDGTAPGLVRLDRDDGSELERVGTPYSCFDIATNGGVAVTAGGSTTLTRIHYYNLSVFPMLETGFTDHGAAVVTCAVDRKRAYFGGARSGAVDVRATNLGTQAQEWGTLLPVTVAPNIQCIRTDGRLVYVAINRRTLGAAQAHLTPSGDVTLFALEPENGEIVWAMDAQTPGQTDDADWLAVDGRHVFLTTDAPDVHVIDVDGPPAMVESFGSLAKAFDADGVSFLNTAGAGAAQRARFQDQEVLFTVKNGKDQNRGPIYKRAVPIW